MESENVINDKGSEDKGVIVIGSRYNEESQVERKLLRKVVSLVNNLFVKQIIGIKDIKDTQCGFKLFNRKAARSVFFGLHLTRWAFDVEMLYIAQAHKMKIIEKPVTWTEVEGSNLQVIPATISFFRDYFAMIAFYNTGFWKLPEY